MHKVKKKTGKIVKAWQLGQDSDMEQKLIADEKIKRLENGTYSLMSLEAVFGGRGGEEAQIGDWFRVEEKSGEFYPYPISNEYFSKNYRKIDDDFEAVPKILAAYFADDQISEEVQWLLDSGKLRLTNDSEKFFVAEIWGTALSATRDSAIIFYSVTRTDGEISEIDFNLIARDAFDRDYIVLE